MGTYRFLVLLSLLLCRAFCRDVHNINFKTKERSFENWVAPKNFQLGTCSYAFPRFPLVDDLKVFYVKNKCKKNFVLYLPTLAAAVRFPLHFSERMPSSFREDAAKYDRYHDHSMVVCACDSMIALEVLWEPQGSECACAGWLVVIWNTVGRILRSSQDSAGKKKLLWFIISNVCQVCWIREW